MDDEFLKKVYGYKRIKEELYLIRSWYLNENNLNNNKKLLPKGILFYGNPGEGKTLFIREFSKSFNYPIFEIKGDDENLENEIISTYDVARKEKCAIVIIDELDQLIEKDDKLTRIIYSQLDGFNESGNVLTLATANHYYDLPEALLREGRFDRKFKVLCNDKVDFKDIIEKFSLDRNLIFNENEKYELIEELFGYSISKIKSIFNFASLKYGTSCSLDNILDTVDYLDTGYLSKKIDVDVGSVCAVHEAGHALYFYLFCKGNKFQRIYFTDGGGRTIIRNINDYINRDCLIERLQGDLAGIAAEEIIFKKHDIGCDSDLKKAKRIAYNLIIENCINQVDYCCNRYDCDMRNCISSYTSKIIDVRVAKFINKNLRYVKRKLKKHKKEIIRLSNYLLENKSIKSEELEKLIPNKN